MWVAKQTPVVWTFHYWEACPNAIGFPLNEEDRSILREWADQISALFTSPLLALDFVLDTAGRWHFLEAAPGGCAGMTHRRAFEVICAKLREKPYQQFQETYAGTL